MSHLSILLSLALLACATRESGTERRPEEEVVVVRGSPLAETGPPLCGDIDCEDGEPDVCLRTCPDGSRELALRDLDGSPQATIGGVIAIGRLRLSGVEPPLVFAATHPTHRYGSARSMGGAPPPLSTTPGRLLALARSPQGQWSVVYRAEYSGEPVRVYAEGRVAVLERHGGVGCRAVVLSAREGHLVEGEPEACLPPSDHPAPATFTAESGGRMASDVGMLSLADVHQVLREADPASDCSTSWTGRATLHVEVAPSGAVTAAVMQTDTGDADFARCVTAGLRAVSFPRSARGRAFDYPLVISARRPDHNRNP